MKLAYITALVRAHQESEPTPDNEMVHGPCVHLGLHDKKSDRNLDCEYICSVSTRKKIGDGLKKHLKKSFFLV
jgi:hypothetical protein